MLWMLFGGTIMLKQGLKDTQHHTDTPNIRTKTEILYLSVVVNWVIYIPRRGIAYALTKKLTRQYEQLDEAERS